MRIGTGATGCMYLGRLALLGLFLIVDMVIQCTSDYDFGSSSSAATASLVLAMLNQLAVAMTTHRIMAQTFPYRIGLAGVVTSRFHKLFLVALLYFILGLFVAGLRVMNVRAGEEADLLSQLVLSSLSKLLAPVYYAMTLRGAYELCFPVYYDEEAWQKILERPLLQERVRMAKEAAKSVRSHRKKTEQHLGKQEGDESSSVGSNSCSSSSIGRK